MKPLADSSASPIKLSTPFRHHRRRFFLIALLAVIAYGASAQTVTWSESFTKGAGLDDVQQGKWAAFLTEISGKRFASVRIWGTFDPVGIKITDPVAAAELARLLSSETPGTVMSDGHTWTVTQCDIGTGVPRGALSVDGNQMNCQCEDKYALRPYSINGDWGGLNSITRSCGSESQTINLEFHSGISIVASGPTTICNGGSVELSVKSEVCSGDLVYEWSTGETTPTIQASKSGSYWVSVYDPVTKCGGTASPVNITSADVTVTVGIEGSDKFCTEPVQLKAEGISVGGAPSATVEKVCLFHYSPFGTPNCDISSGSMCDKLMVEVPDAVSYSAKASGEKPSELRYNLYYYYNVVSADFTFFLNGQKVGHFKDSSPGEECRVVGTNAPVVITIDQSAMKDFWVSGENTISVQVDGAPSFFLVAISAEVVRSNATYSWTPTTDLNMPDIQNPLASPSKTTTYTVTYTDANGCQASASVEVKGCEDTPPAPIANCATLVVPLETGCTVTRTAEQFNNGSTSPAGLPLTYSIEPAGPFGIGTTNVTLTVTDSEGRSSTCAATITVTDVIAPVIPALADVIVSNEPGTCSATHVLVPPVLSDICPGTTISHDYVDELNQPKTTFPEGTTSVTWTAADASGNTSTTIQKVVVTNIAPVITSVSASASTIAIKTPVILGVVYEDDNVKSATINWGDGSQPSEVISPATLFEATHTYQSAGEYTITVTLTDLCEASIVHQHGPIVVFDRRAGTVKGGGWFDSPPGAYKKDERAAGRGSFSFTAGYTSYSNVPVGSASFTFKPGGLKFRSTTFDLLLIDGEVARLTGRGTVNGKPGYDLLISMVDDDTKVEKVKGGKKPPLKWDRVRVKISDAAGIVIYDNQSGPDDAIATTRISSGSIEIEATTFQTGEETESIEASAGEEGTSVYPNPFTDYLNVQYNTQSTESLVVKLTDLAGRVMATGVFPVSHDGSYSLDIPENAEEGIYILTIKQGQNVELLTVVRK